MTQRLTHVPCRGVQGSMRHVHKLVHGTLLAPRVLWAANPRGTVMLGSSQLNRSEKPEYVINGAEGRAGVNQVPIFFVFSSAKHR